MGRNEVDVQKREKNPTRICSVHNKQSLYENCGVNFREWSENLLIYHNIHNKYGAIFRRCSNLLAECRKNSGGIFYGII